MISATRTVVSTKEELLLKFLTPISELSISRKRVKNPEMFLSARRLLEIAEINIHTLSGDVLNKLDCSVTQICRVGSRFSKNCICVQFAEDANELMHWAMENGALFCITREPIEGVLCIVSDSPETVYMKMCRYFRGNLNTEVTAIVGSIGKTTTKKMVDCVYSSQYNTFCDPENENQIDCVGYICQHIPPKTIKHIQEVSEDTPGCLSLISQMISPKIAVITAIDKSHIENFGDAQKIIEEIYSVTDGMDKDSTVIVNMDDNNYKSVDVPCKILKVSMYDKEADFYADSINITPKGLTFDIVEKSTQLSYPIKLINVFAKHNIYSALYAFAAGVCSGVDHENIIKGLKNYRSVGIRQNIYTAGNSIIYADCYNAVASSVASAVSTSDEMPVNGKRVAVLGDIEESGELSEQIHLELIKIINNSKFDVFIAYGPKLLKALENAELRSNLDVLYCKNRQELNAAVKKAKKGAGLILFKASRKSALEKTIENVFPFAYKKQKINYLLPIIKWRLKVVLN